jgi:hypothetical protein
MHLTFQGEATMLLQSLLDTLAALASLALAAALGLLLARRVPW